MIALDSVSAFCRWLTSAKGAKDRFQPFNFRAKIPLHLPGTPPSATSPWSPSPDKVRSAVEVIDQNEEFIKMTLAVMMTPD